MVQVIGRTLQHQELSDTIETQDLLNVVVDYTYALDTLNNYDYKLQSFPASGSFPMSQFFASGGQSVGVSASASFLPGNIQD